MFTLCPRAIMHSHCKTYFLTYLVFSFKTRIINSSIHNCSTQSHFPSSTKSIIFLSYLFKSNPIDWKITYLIEYYYLVIRDIFIYMYIYLYIYNIYRSNNQYKLHCHNIRVSNTLRLPVLNVRVKMKCLFRISFILLARAKGVLQHV